MQSRFKESLFQRITEKLPARPYYPASLLTGPDLPADIGHFLSQTLRRRALLEGELIVSRTSDWFDFEDASVRTAIGSFLQTLSHEARFPQDDFDRILRKAVHSCTDYLIDPSKTIADFAVTDRKNDNSPADVRRRAGYFLHYGYLLASVESFLSGFTGEQVERDQLLNHLRETETKNLGAETVDDWIHLLVPLAKAGHYAFDQRSSIPLEMVETFFECKKRKDLADAARSLKNQTGEMVTSDELALVLKKVLEPEPIRPAYTAPSVGSASSGGAKESQGDLPLWKQYAKEAHATTGDSLKAPKGAPSSEPLWKAYRHENDAEEVGTNEVGKGESNATPSESDRHPGPESPPEPVTQPQAVAHPQPITQPQPASQPQPIISFPSEIESRILGESASERDRFVHDLFRGDEQTYRQSLERLASVRDWDTASNLLLNEVYRRFEVDIYSNTAVAFTNAVERSVKQRS